VSRTDQTATGEGGARMFMYVLLIIGLAVVSAIVGMSLRKRQLARRGEAMRQAA
jgi:hypothetical protein